MFRKLVLFALLTSAILVGSAHAQPYYARGSFYSGSGATWDFDAGNQLHDDGLHGDGLAGDGVYAATVISDQPPGFHQFKIANADWSELWPHHSYFVLANAQVYTSGPGEAIFFRLDTGARPGWFPESGAVMTDHALPAGTALELMGSAPELGSWNNPVAATVQGGVWSTEVQLADAGLVDYKFRSIGSWDWPFGIHYNMLLGDNFIFVNTHPGARVVFMFDSNDGRSTVEIPTPVNPISWSGVKRLPGHN